MLLKFKPHDDLQISVHSVSEIWVSLNLIKKALRFGSAF